MPRTQVSAVVLLLVALVLHHSTALLVTPPPATRPLTHPELSETERLVREWTVTADSGQSLQSIVAVVACQVFVSYAPASDAVATVRVVGDNAAILENAVAVSSSADGELRLEAPTVHGPKEIEGHVRAEIIVHNAYLVSSIQAAGSGDVVVDSHVLVDSNPNLNITAHASSSGDLYLPPQLHVTAQALHLQLSSSGSIQAVAASVAVRDVEVRVAGSGSVQFGADSLQAASTTVVNSGSGSTDLFLSRFNSGQLLVKSSGSGDVKVARDVTTGGGDLGVAECALKSSGAGNVKTDSVVCMTAQAVASGSGDITMAVSQMLMCKASGSGGVSAHTGGPSTATLGCKVRVLSGTSMPETPPAWMYAYSLPPRKSSQAITVFGDESPGRDDGEDHGDDESDEDRDDDQVTEDTPSWTQYVSLWKPVVVVLLSITVLALWQRRDASQGRHQKPNEKTPLLSEDAPVYI